MNHQTENLMIESSMTQLTQIVTNSKDDSIKQFKKSLDQISQMYHDKSKQNKKKIEHQQLEIKNLEKRVKEQKKIIKQMMSASEEEDSKILNNIEEQRFQNPNNQIQPIFEYSPNNQPIQNQNNNHQLLTNGSISSLDHHQNHISTVTIKKEGEIGTVKMEVIEIMDDQNKEKNESKKQKKSIYKKPLQSCKGYTIFQLSYTPNIKRLKYIHYLHQLNKINNDQIEFLRNCDLSSINSVHLSGSSMENNIFKLFTKLNWQNLLALKIDKNNISDLRPLKRFNLRKLQDLDVSYNPLEKQSAIFLSQQPFNKLIELSVSFKKGLDDECWKTILGKKMDNYPKIQVVNVGNCNQLKKTTKQAIGDCLQSKSQQQMAQDLEYYGQNEGVYKIKIKWMVSSDELKNMSKIELDQSTRKGERQVKIRSVVIKKSVIFRHLRGGKKRNRIMRTHPIKKEEKEERINRGDKENVDRNRIRS